METCGRHWKLLFQHSPLHEIWGTMIRRFGKHFSLCTFKAGRDKTVKSICNWNGSKEQDTKMLKGGEQFLKSSVQYILQRAVTAPQSQRNRDTLKREAKCTSTLVKVKPKAGSIFCSLSGGKPACSHPESILITAAISNAPQMVAVSACSSGTLLTLTSKSVKW